MDSNSYITTAVEQSQVLYKEFPKDSDKELAKIKADIEYVYPIGTPGFLSFHKASWILTSDNIIAVQLLLPRPEMPEPIIVIGTWEPHNEVVKLHIAGRGLYGLTITMDGLLRPSNGGYRMTGIFTVTVRDARHVEQVDLYLTQVSNLPPNYWVAPTIEGARQRTAFEHPIREEHTPLSEPREWIGGVPIPTNFDATINVKLDGVELAPMKGQLLLRRMEGVAEPTIGLILTTEGSIMPGRSAWITSRDTSQEPHSTSQVPKPTAQQASPFIRQAPQMKVIPESSETNERGVEVTAENGRIRVTITPAPPFRQVSWYTRNPERPEDTAMVLVDKGVIDLQVTNDRFSGTINAQGTVLESKRPVSTFSARLSGARQGATLVKGIVSYVGPRPFDGRWHDSRLGELNLSQQRDKVSGTFSGGGTIKGIVTGPVLNLTWKEPKGGSGRGFLSTSDSGFLVGMTWNEEKSLSPEPVIAIQVESPTKPGDKAGEIPSPENDAQAQELKYLGYDLSSAGKHQEAARVLLKVVTYFKDRSEEPANDAAAEGSYLLSQAVPLYTLINSAFETGDYPILLQSLRMAIDVQRKMGKGSADRRSFLEQVQKYIAQLNNHAETMDKLAAGFDRGLNSLSAAGIGVNFQEEPDNSGIKISGVRPGMPASRAGVIAGDLLVAIDGVPVASMSQEQAIIRLRGDAETSVSIGLIRGGQPLKLKLVREPLINLAPEQKDELNQAMTGIHNLAAHASQDCRAEADDLKRLLKGTTDFSVAFKELTTRIADRQRSIEDKRPAAIALVKRSLAASFLALDLFQRFVSLQDEFIKYGKLDDESSARMLKLDQDEDEFERNPDASDLDKGLLRMSIIITGELDNMWGVTRGRLRIVNTAAESSSQASSPVKTADTLAALSSWLDNWRSMMATDAAKIASLELGQDFYKNYVRTLFDLNLPEQGLQASESARARAFADLLSSNQKMRSELNRVFQSERVLPNPITAPPLSVQEIKEIAAAQGGTLVEYFLLDNSIVIWTISPEGEIREKRVEVKRLELDENIERLNKLFGQEDLAGEKGHEKRSEAAKLLCWLDEILIMPLEKENLLPSDSKTLLTIIPHGSLFRVPFSALLDKNGRYLVEKYPLSYATALSVLKYTQKISGSNAPEEKQRHLLALVNPDPMPDSTLKPLTGTESYFYRIESLYGSRDKSEVYVGHQATEEILRKHALGADVLYFATHAEANEKEPFESFIALGKTGSHNGYLKVSDIYTIDLHAELVILAACETGRGGISGDGVDGLSRAFTWAGASTVLLTLWEVEEMQTLEQLYEFHHYWMQKKFTKAHALREAQLRRLSLYRNQPNLWAGLVIYGNPD